ncbi:flagellar regulatory protein FliZ, partial [Salmonella enterica subsp. enterica serovar Kentucky]|nr:flagellar regulatory protein FliZ [Salmonella enterica subsp. enterica serovar Kentucky]
YQQYKAHQQIAPRQKSPFTASSDIY